MSEESYNRAREIPELKACIGCILVDITETDKDERDRGEPDLINLHFSNGTVIKFQLGPIGFNVDL